MGEDLDHDCLWRDKYLQSREDMISLVQTLSEDDLRLIASLISIITRLGDDDARFEMESVLIRHGRTFMMKGDHQ